MIKSEVSKRGSGPEGAEQVETEIRVKLNPRSSRNQITGRDQGVYCVKVTPPPVGGLANKALIGLLAKNLKIPKGNIEIRSGKHSRMKRVRISGLSEGEILSRLG